VRGRDGVQADVDNGAEDGEREIGAGESERDGGKPSGRDEAAAEHEGKPAAATFGGPPIAPEPDGERHEQAGRRIDEHHGADLPRGVLDPVEQHRQVAGRHGSAQPCPERRRAEDEQVGEMRDSRRRGFHVIGDHAHGATTGKEAGSTASVTGPVPRLTVSAMTGD
jgi:hypothetical protein